MLGLVLCYALEGSHICGFTMGLQDGSALCWRAPGFDPHCPLQLGDPDPLLDSTGIACTWGRHTHMHTANAHM